MQEIAHRNALVPLICQALDYADFNWDAARAPVEQPYEWARPPLVTEQKLSGIPLQPHAAIACGLDLDGMTEAYEHFIAAFIRRRGYLRTKPAAWLQKHLSLTPLQASTLFVQPEWNQVRRDLHLNLVQIAALVAYNVPSEVEQGPDTFLTTTEREGLRFGVWKGQLASNMRREFVPVPVRFLHSVTGKLQDIARGAPVYPPGATLYDVARRWGELQGIEGLELALRVLWWRWNGRVPQALWEMTLRSTSREALHHAVKAAREYPNFEAPLATMADILVPQFLTQPQFQKKFGNPYQPVRLPLQPWLRDKWNQALDDLDPGPPAQ